MPFWICIEVHYAKMSRTSEFQTKRSPDDKIWYLPRFKLFCIGKWTCIHWGMCFSWESTLLILLKPNEACLRYGRSDFQIIIMVWPPDNCLNFNIFETWNFLISKLRQFILSKIVVSESILEFSGGSKLIWTPKSSRFEEAGLASLPREPAGHLGNRPAIWA